MKLFSRFWTQWAVLVGCGVALAAVLHIGFATRYSLTIVGDKARQSTGTLASFSNEGAYWYIGASLMMFVVYVLGYWLLKHRSIHYDRFQTRWTLVIIGVGAVVLSAVMLQYYPTDASDIYDYIIRGRMSALYGLNPMEDVPQLVANDPLFRFVSWRMTPSAYGPVWELLAHAVSTLTSDLSINAQVIAYKGIALVGYALTGVFIILILRHIAPQRVVIGAYLFFWNPLVVYMTAGTGHNDALMTAFVTFGLYALCRRWFVVATLGAGLGVLLKFLPALLIPVIALVALRELGLRRWLWYALVSATIGGIIAVILYIPYWHGLDTLRTNRREFMHTGSFATVARLWLLPIMDNITDLSTYAREAPNSRTFVANVTALLFGIFTLFRLATLWREREAIAPIRAIAQIFMCYLLVASMWFHAWYVIWLVALVALLEDTPLRRVTLVFSYLVTWQAFLYNYMTFRTRSGDFLPWGDILPVTIFLGIPTAYLIWNQMNEGLRHYHVSAQTRQEAGWLRVARQNDGISLSDLSDQLGIPYEQLIQYEQGTRSMRLDHARMLAQRFGVRLDDLIGEKA